MLHSFKGGLDGSSPTAGLIDVHGTLYGTTQRGGAKHAGTVFEVRRSGERVLYSFNGGTDGAQPIAGLIDVHGTLYGTAYSGGGASNAGTIFEVYVTECASGNARRTSGSSAMSPVPEALPSPSRRRTAPAWITRFARVVNAVGLQRLWRKLIEGSALCRRDPFQVNAHRFVIPYHVMIAAVAEHVATAPDADDVEIYRTILAPETQHKGRRVPPESIEPRAT